jgi:uncharacterized protein (DUF488 family)
MNGTLFTIGFTKKTAEEFFGLLREACVERVIDIREQRTSQLAGFAKYPDIAFFLKSILGAEYRYEPLLAPSPEIRDAYRKTRDWEQYEKSFRALMNERNVLELLDASQFAGKIALLCSEAGPEKCHRRLVAEMLAARWNGQGHRVDVHHLFIERPRPPRKRPAKGHARADSF